MTDSDTFHVYLHSDNKGEGLEKMLNGLLDDYPDDHDTDLERTLRGLAYDLKLTYELDRDTGTVHLLGAKDGHRVLGRHIPNEEVTWNHDFEEDRLP